MAYCRNLLLHGLSLLLRRLGAIGWLFLFSVLTALLFSVGLHNQLAGLLDHSLATAGLVHGFDLLTAAGAFLRLQRNVPGSPFSPLAVPVFLLLYFVLTPGILFCYLSNERARLSTMLRQGVLHFWRFVRITVAALIVFAVILGPLIALNTAWAKLIDERVVGRPGFALRLAGTLIVFLVGSLLRLYFDLVEIYTVQLGVQVRPNGKFDRRVRRAFGPALRSLRLHFLRAWGGFLLLSLVALVGVSLLSRTALHTLAQPRVWPLVLFSQLAVLFGLAMRLWQRGAEVTLVQDHPILPIDDVRAPGARTAPVTRTAPVVAAAAPIARVSPVPAYAPVAPAAPILAPEPLVEPLAPLAPVAAVGAPLVTPLQPQVPVTAPLGVAPGIAPGTVSSAMHQPGGAQPLQPPADLPPEQVPDTTAVAPPPAADEPLHQPPTAVVPPDPSAPIHSVYDIDPFTALPVPPNPLPTETEERLPGKPPEPPFSRD